MYDVTLGYSRVPFKNSLNDEDYLNSFKIQNFRLFFFNVVNWIKNQDTPPSMI